MTGSSSKVNLNAGELSKLAKQLNEMVGKFKVSKNMNAAAEVETDNKET